MMFSKKKEEKKKPEKAQGLTVDAYTDLMRSKQLYRIIIAFLSFTVLILAFMLQGKKTEIVVMPPDYYEPVIVDGKYANRSYTAGHALAVAVTLGNISPKNVEFVTESFMKMLSPRLQSMLSNSLETESKLLARKRARQTFEVEDVMFRNSDNLVWVWGTKSTTVGANTGRENFTYEMRIEPNNGSPKITHFDAYPGKPKMRNAGPVEVTPYLSRELALVKQFAPGEIIVTPTDTSVHESVSNEDETLSNLENETSASITGDNLNNSEGD